MLKWPERAKAAIRKLFEPLQDIDVYVEDSNDEAFYRALLNYATNGQIKIARVFSLGGRRAVIDAAAAHDQNLRRALFIVDGDLPWVSGESAPVIVGLHRHDAYCVENLLLCEKALSSIVSQEILVTEDQAAERLAFSQWQQQITQPLVELFAAFATVYQFSPSVPTVSQGVGVMCVKRRGQKIHELDPEKVRKARDHALAAAAATSTLADVSARYAQVHSRIAALPNSLHAVSGKDFLLPLLDFHLQSIGCRVKRKSLRIRLACAGEAARFSPLAASLSAAAGGFK